MSFGEVLDLTADVFLFYNIPGMFVSHDNATKQSEQNITSPNAFKNYSTTGIYDIILHAGFAAAG